jgi:Fibronectin type III domain
VPVHTSFYFRRWTLILADIVSLLLGLCSLAEAADSVSLAWDPVNESDIVGYRLHYGTSSGNYIVTIDLGSATTATASSLTIGATYFFVVTAYNTAGLESSPSGEVSFTATPNQPPAIISSMLRLSDGSFQLTLTIAANTATTVNGVGIYVSGDLKTWTLLSHILNPSGTLIVTDPDAAFVDRRFYRVSIP